MTRRRAPAILLAASLASCAHPAGDRARSAPIAAAEDVYQETRLLKDQIDVTRARGVSISARGVSLVDLKTQYRASRQRLVAVLTSDAQPTATGDDEQALALMRGTLEKDLGEESDDSQTGAVAASAKVDCDYDAARLAQGADGMRALGERMYGCFGHAAHALPFEGKTLDRLTIFSLLPVTEDAERRRRLFLAFGPVWTAVNGDDGAATSPYRQLVRLSAAKLAAAGSSVETGARDLGIAPADVESWLMSVLESWRRIAPGEPIEPWDFAYRTGAASRALRSAIPLESLRSVNDRFYADLGADVAALGVHYDLEPRDGKNPVAYTTFGARPRLAGGVWAPGEPWVFASYSIGSVDNLNELLHESGHAVHIAAIRTRPAFMDWPDSDLFTEAIADIAALEMFEPEWQKKYLKTSVPLADSIRAKYAGIVMDTAWALFEIRMHRSPGADPNAVWTEITGRYFGIRPHPELSWWALRGQLIDLPGYMLNYAIGAILVADLRARAHELHGSYAEGDPSWYAWMSERLYRFGLERPSRRVIEDFLGRPISPRALLDDMARARPAS